jgi:uncharacterized membrane protein YecN with MAPEG domain
MPTITLLYAGILGIISIILAAGVGRSRGAAGISIGLGDDQALLVANRRHGNFVEYVPLALILMGLLEANGVDAAATHSFGVVLTLSRIAHPIGLRADTMSHPLRAIGAIGTIGVMLVMSIWAIVLFF